MPKPITDKFIDFLVVVTRTSGQAVVGELIETDNFGVFVRAEVESDHEVKDKIAVYIPHKDITMIHATEADNFHMIEHFSHEYNNLFGER